MLFNKTRIIVNLMGGLGNQMFQYALGRHLSLKNNLPLCFNTNFFKNDSCYKRDFELSAFNIDAKVQKRTSFPIKFVKKLKIGSLFKNTIREPELFNNTKEYEEKLLKGQPVNKFNKNILDAKIIKSIEITGYWQSEEYFSEIAEILQKDFSLKNPISIKKQNEAEKIINSNAVCIGIRQYNESKEALKHFKLTSDYYSKAITLLEHQVSNPTFFIFTLDIDWAKNNITTKYPIDFISISSSKSSPHEDIYLMSLCKHFIIPNSTFHWWGAWLSLNKNKIIIAPQKGWTNTNPTPKGWITI